MSIVADIAKGLAAPITGLISEFVEDKDKAAEIAFKVSTMAATHAHAQALAQMEVNKAEAESGSLFKGGWRPATGWCCVAGMGINFIIIPMFGPVIEAYTPIVMSSLDISEMMPVLIGMLGLTAARTVEKQSGVAAR